MPLRMAAHQLAAAGVEPGHLPTSRPRPIPLMGVSEGAFPLEGFFFYPKKGNYLLNLICLIFLLKNEVQLRYPEKP